MSIRQLRTLLAVRDHGSFSAAAERCFITHAAVSQQMKALEQTWNIPLFDRRRRSPQLTPLGRAVAAKADEVLRAYDNIVPSVLDSNRVAGEIQLGAVPTTLTGLVPLAVSRLKRHFADLHVAIQPGLSTALLQGIERGRLDAAILTKPAQLPTVMNSQVIATEPLQLLAPPQTPSDDPFFLLRQYPFIRFDRDAMVGQMIQTWLAEQDITVNDSMELEGLEAISSMVAANLGVSIVPDRCVREMSPVPVKRLSLGANAPTRQLCLAWRQDNPNLKMIDAVCDALSQAVSIGAFAPEGMAPETLSNAPA
jgi:DNA-binding transcriptional LysR family regulator